MSKAVELTYTTTEQPTIGINVDGERFVMAPVPGMVWLDFLKLSMRPDPEDAKAKAAKELEETTALFDIFGACMEPEEYERFAKFARSSRGPDVTMLMQIVQDVVGASAESFPTQPSSPSAPGPSATGPGSTDGASSPGSTSNDSPSDDSPT